MISRVKALFQNLKDDVFLKYPVTVIGIWIGAVLVAIYSEYTTRDNSEFVLKVVQFVWIFNAGSLFTEVIFDRSNRLKQIIGYCIAALIAISYVGVAGYNKYYLFGLKSERVHVMAFRLLLVYLAWIAALCIYRMFKNSGQQFETYCLSAFCGAARTSIVYGLFALGLAMVIWVFDTLIADTGSMLPVTEIVLACGLYTQGLLLAFSKPQETFTRFLEIVVKYVLLLLTIAAFAVIYLYIFKIIIQWDLPSNEVFGILSWLFALGMPVLTVAGHCSDDRIGKLALKLPYAFVPFVALQVLCIGIRIHEYGLTDARYSACVLIIVECIYLILYRLDRHKMLPYMLQIMALISTLTFFAPVVNGDSMVFTSQRLRFERYLNKVEQGVELDYQDARRFVGAYDALWGTEKGDAYLGAISDSQIRLVKQYRNTYSSHDEEPKITRTYGRASATDAMDIAGHNMLYEVKADSRDLEKSEIIDMNHIKFYGVGSDIEVTVDLADFAQTAHEYDRDDEEIDVWMADNYVFKLDDGTELYVSYLGLEYNENSEEFTYYCFEGYYLK